MLRNGSYQRLKLVLKSSYIFCRQQRMLLLKVDPWKMLPRIRKVIIVFGILQKKSLEANICIMTMKNMVLPV